jgi:hypothetical protein
MIDVILFPTFFISFPSIMKRVYYEYFQPQTKWYIATKFTMIFTLFDNMNKIKLPNLGNNKRDKLRINVILRRVREMIVSVEKQKLLHNPSMCL